MFLRLLNNQDLISRCERVEKAAWDSRFGKERFQAEGGRFLEGRVTPRRNMGDILPSLLHWPVLLPLDFPRCGVSGRQR